MKEILQMLPNLHLHDVIKNTNEIKAVLDNTKGWGGNFYDRLYLAHRGPNSEILSELNEQPLFKNLVQKVLGYMATPTKDEFLPELVKVSFINKYTGNDYLVYHDDYDIDENEGTVQVFVTVSIGATRILHFKNKKTGRIDQSYELKDGDLFIFNPVVNETHEHGMDKEPGAGVRYSLLIPLEYRFRRHRVYWK